MNAKPAPPVPPLFRSDLLEARKVLGCEPKWPVGCVLSPFGYAEMKAYPARFPCPVAVDRRMPRDTVLWIYLPQNFQPFANLIKESP